MQTRSSSRAKPTPSPSVPNAKLTAGPSTRPPTTAVAAKAKSMASISQAQLDWLDRKQKRPRSDLDENHLGNQPKKLKFESASQQSHVREALGQANSPTIPFASYPTALPGIYSSQPTSASQGEGLSGITTADSRLSANVSDTVSPLMETILERQSVALAKKRKATSSRSVSQGSSNSPSPFKSEDTISKRRHVSMDAVIEHQRISGNGKARGSQDAEQDSGSDVNTSNSISAPLPLQHRKYYRDHTAGRSLSAATRTEQSAAVLIPLSILHLYYPQYATPTADTSKTPDLPRPTQASKPRSSKPPTASTSSIPSYQDEEPPYTLPPLPYSAKKPDQCYAAIIGQAILSSPRHRLTLQQIYDWITTVYPYFHRGEQTWMTSIRHVLSTTVFFRKVTRDRCFGRAQWAIWDQDLPCFKDGGFDRHAHEVKKKPPQEDEEESQPEAKTELPKPRRKAKKSKPKQGNTGTHLAAPPPPPKIVSYLKPVREPSETSTVPTDTDSTIELSPLSPVETEHFPLPPPPPKVVSYLKPAQEPSKTSTLPTDVDSTLVLSSPSPVKTENNSTRRSIENRKSPACEEGGTRPTSVASGPSASISPSMIDSDDEEVDQLDPDEYNDVYVAPPTAAPVLPRQVTALSEPLPAKIKSSKMKRVSFAGFAEEDDWSAGLEMCKVQETAKPPRIDHMVLRTPADWSKSSPC